MLVAFAVDYENNYERRQYLASMLLPNDPDEGRLVLLEQTYFNCCF